MRVNAAALTDFFTLSGNPGAAGSFSGSRPQG